MGAVEEGSEVGGEAGAEVGGHGDASEAGERSDDLGARGGAVVVSGAADEHHDA
jgi:hypothetical protein